MNEQETLTVKQELLDFLQEVIKTIQNISDQEISKQQIRLLVDNGIGYAVNDNRFRLWVVKKIHDEKSDKNDSKNNG